MKTEVEVARISEELQGSKVVKIVIQHKVVFGLVGETASLDPLQIHRSLD